MPQPFYNYNRNLRRHCKTADLVSIVVMSRIADLTFDKFTTVNNIHIDTRTFESIHCVYNPHGTIVPSYHGRTSPVQNLHCHWRQINVQKKQVDTVRLQIKFSEQLLPFECADVSLAHVFYD